MIDRIAHTTFRLELSMGLVLLVTALPASASADEGHATRAAQCQAHGHLAEGHELTPHLSPGDPPVDPSAQDGGEAIPVETGQDAFAALREMRQLLLATPTTSWSQVDLDSLREHLVDMNRVVLDAQVAVDEVPGGFTARITGSGRTLEAIRRLVRAHAGFMNGREGLATETAALGSDSPSGPGVQVTVTTDDPTAVQRLRSLGFFGFLVQGDHHRPHHRAMAIGSGHP